MGRVAIVLFLIGCGASPTPATPSEPAPATADPADDEAPATPPAAGPDVAIVRVVSSGPIGSGRCVQCSHELAIERPVSGGLTAGTTLWAHFEWCEGAPPPTGLDPCSMDVGARYEVELATGASANFPGGPMIARAAAAP